MAPQPDVSGLHRFIYRPFPDNEAYIRLLDILPGKGDEILRCSTVHISREESVDTYEPISYSWGVATDREEIICDEQRLVIVASLAVALRRFRLEDKPRRVWADGVCVNQRDLEEKGPQVKHMGTVYEQGTRTLIWLGEDTLGIALDTFKLVEETVSYLDELFNERGEWSFPKARAIDGMCSDKERWDNVSKMYNTTWFERVWIIQEAGLSKEATVYWGAAVLDVASVMELAFWISWRGDLFNHRPIFPAGRMCDSFAQIQSSFTAPSGKSWRGNRPFLKYLAAEYGPKKLFVSILDTARESKATDGRDHIFGFLGHPCARKENGDLMFVPDYRTPLETVCVNTAVALLNHPREARWLLSRVIHHHSKDIGDGFPSWVPRWHNGWVQHPVGGPLYSWRAGGPPEDLQHRFIPEEKALAVKGFFLDRLTWTSILIDRDNLRLQPQRWIYDAKTLSEPPIDTLWKEVLQAVKPAPEELDSLDQAFSQSVASGYSRITKLGVGTHQACYKTYLALSRANLRAFQGLPPAEEESKGGGEGGGEAPKEEGDPFDYYFRTRHSQNRRLAFTEKRRLAHVDGLAEEGDILVVILGLQSPYLVRPAGEGRYHLVGASFVHGTMEGELLEELAKGTYTLEDIVLV